MKRRSAMTAGLLATLLTVLVLVVGVAVYASTIRSDVTHLQGREAEDREAAKAERLSRAAEDRAIRTEMGKQRRADAERTDRLVRTTTRIEALLGVLERNSRTKTRHR